MQPAGGGGEQAGVYFFSSPEPQPPGRTPVSEKVYESTGNCALLFPFTVTLRRSHDVCINQRIDSLPCPALFLNVSGAASPLLGGRGFHEQQRSACAGS